MTLLPAPDRERAIATLRSLRAVAMAADPDTVIEWEHRPRGLRVTRLTAQARLLRDAPDVVLLDATPPMRLLSALRPDLRVVSVAVRETASITREVLYRSDGARRSLVPDGRPDWSAFEWLLVAGLSQVGDYRRILIVSHRPLIRPLQDDSETAPSVVAVRERLRELIGDRVVHLSYFGALRGLNLYAECDAVVTIGDPWPDVGDFRAMCRLIGLEDGEVDDAMREHVAAELAQVHGRLRDVRRTEPARHVHVGAIAPADWTTDTARVVPTRRGRPLHPRTISPALLRELVNRLGGIAAAARRTGVPRSSLSAALRGTRPVPAKSLESLIDAAELVGLDVISAV